LDEVQNIIDFFHTFMIQSKKGQEKSRL